MNAFKTVALAALAVGSVVALGISQGQGGDLLAKVRAAGVIRVANTQASPPWSLIDTQKQVVGFDVDFAREVARRIGVPKVEFVAGRFADFIAGIQADKYDAVIAGQTATEERKKVVDFSNPYQAISVAVFARPTKADAYKTLEDLKGKRVAVTAGSTQEKLVREKVPEAIVKTYENGTLALLDVGVGRADVGLFNRYVGAYLAEKNGLGVVPAFNLGVEYNGVSFRKGEAAFKAAVDKAIADMLEDGSFGALCKKWLGGQDMSAEVRKAPKN